MTTGGPASGSTGEYTSREWWQPGMSEAEIQNWLAAERAAADAPEITPGDEVWMQLKPLLADFGAGIDAARVAEQERGAA